MKIIPYNKTTFDDYGYEIATVIRYKIIDDDNKIIDDAQGHGYKSKASANKAMAYKFKGGKQKKQAEVKNRKEFFKKYEGLEQFIEDIFENNHKEIVYGNVTDDDILLHIKNTFGVDMPLKYLYNK